MEYFFGVDFFVLFEDFVDRLEIFDFLYILEKDFKSVIFDCGENNEKEVVLLFAAAHELHLYVLPVLRVFSVYVYESDILYFSIFAEFDDNDVIDEFFGNFGVANIIANSFVLESRDFLG